MMKTSESFLSFPLKLHSAFSSLRRLDLVEDLSVTIIFVVCLFACLFGVFTSHSRIFHAYGDATITGGRLQIYANFELYSKNHGHRAVKVL